MPQSFDSKIEEKKLESISENEKNLLNELENDIIFNGREKHDQASITPLQKESYFLNKKNKKIIGKKNEYQSKID